MVDSNHNRTGAFTVVTIRHIRFAEGTGNEDIRKLHSFQVYSHQTVIDGLMIAFYHKYTRIQRMVGEVTRSFH